MLTIILLAFGGAAAITAIALTRGGSAGGAPVVVAAPLEFSETITHSPEWRARQAAGTRILFIGDSLVTSKYWRGIALPGAKLDGQGWKSQQIAAVTKNAAPMVKKFAPTDVVFLAGANDVVADHPPERIERDYAAAWKAIRDSAPGARVWAVLLTPWAGHKKSSATRQVVTREVNGWVRVQKGLPGGPDFVIDPAELGDAEGRLLPAYSGDGLHMKPAGYKALGAVVERALRGGMMTQANVGAAGVLTVEMFDAITVGAMIEMYDAEAGDDAVDVGAEAFNEPQVPGVDIGPGFPKWPIKWRKPTAEILAAVKEASVKYDVPEEIIFAVIRKESSFNPKVRGVVLKGSYARNKDIKIPGSSITWGEKFAEDEWRALGICQVVNFNLFGVRGLLKASDPISKAFDVRTNVMAGARVLKILYDKYGTWEESVWQYNGSKKYQREVFAFLETFRAAQVVA